MPIDYDLLDEGDTLNAASLNTRISSLQTGVNDLQKEDLEEQALRSEHFGSILRYTDMILYGAVNGMMKVSNVPNATTPAFDNRIYDGLTYNRNVVFIGGNSGTLHGYSVISSRPVVGIAPPGPFPGAQSDCNISFSPSVNVVSPTSPATGFSDTTYCSALLVRLNVSLIDTPSPASAAGVVIGIAWEEDGALGTYNFINRSEAGIGAVTAADVDEMINFSDLSTSVLITSDDTVGALIARISGVLAMIDGSSVSIREWNMSVIPIFGGTL